jgi:hypothetical protein
MSSFLTDVATTNTDIVVANSDDRPQTAEAAVKLQANGQVERRRRPRSSFVARPVGVQFRQDFKLFRVR